MISRAATMTLCRFVNGYASTGQGFTGDNMFAYCLNSPVQLINKTRILVALENSGGCYSPSLNTGSQIEKTINDLSPAYRVCAGLILVNGSLPVGDIVGLAGVLLAIFTKRNYVTVIPTNRTCYAIDGTRSIFYMVARAGRNCRGMGWRCLIWIWESIRSLI